MTIELKPTPTALFVAHQYLLYEQKIKYWGSQA